MKLYMSGKIRVEDPANVSKFIASKRFNMQPVIVADVLIKKADSMPFSEFISWNASGTFFRNKNSLLKIFIFSPPFCYN